MLYQMQLSVSGWAELFERHNRPRPDFGARRPDDIVICESR